MKIPVFLRKHLQATIFIGLILVIFGVAYRHLLPWREITTADLTPWFPSAGAAWQNFTSAWSNIYMGKVSPLTPGEFIAQFSTLLVSGNNATAAQGIFYLSLLPLSAVTMYIFLHRFVESKLARILVAILYGVNGLTIEWFLAGGQAMLPWHVFFPLLMLYLIKILEDKEQKLLNMLIFSLFFGLIISFQVYMYMLWDFLPFIIIFYLVEIAYRKNREYFKVTSLSLIGTGVILSLILAPILVNAVQTLLGYYSSTGSAVNNGGYPADVLLNSIKQNYSIEPTTTMFNIYTYVIATFTFFTLFLRKSKRFRHYLGFLLLSALILLASKLFPLNWALAVFEKVPILYVIRSPNRLAFILSWTIFPMMGILVNEIQINLLPEAFNRHRWAQVLASIALCVILITPSVFFIRADNTEPFNNSYNNATSFLNNSANLGENDVGVTPSSFGNIRDWLNEHHKKEGFFRTVWLPCSKSLMNKVILRYDPMTLFETSDKLGPSMLSLMPLVRGSTSDIGKLLAPFDVKYIVVSYEKWEGEYLANDYQGIPRIVFDDQNGTFLVGDPYQVAALLDKQNDIKLATNNHDFAIYENLDFTPGSHISAYNKLFVLAPISTLISAPKAGDFLIDSNFENGFDSWVPDKSLIGAEYSIDTSISHSGNSSLRMEMNRMGSNATVSTKVAANEKESYILSIWLKGENTNTAGIKVFFRDSQDRFIKVNDNNYLGFFLPVGEEWSKEEYLIYVPQGTVNINVGIDMGMDWSIIDKSKPAVAWFDDITFSKPISSVSPAQNPMYLYGGIDQFPSDLFSDSSFLGDAFYPFLHGQMLVQVPKLLSKLPYVNDSDHLLVYGDFLSSDDLSQNLDLSNAAVFLGDIDSSKPYEKWTDYSKPILSVYEAESSLVFSPMTIDNLSGTWHLDQTALGVTPNIVQSEDLSYGQGIELQGGLKGEKLFFNPRGSYFRALIRTQSSDNLTIEIDGQPVDIFQSYPGDNGFSLYETKPIYLDTGNHQLTFKYTGGGVILDQFLLLSTKDENSTFKDVFYSEPPAFDYTEINPSKYDITLKSDEPSVIIQKDSFHLDWELKTASGEKSEHFTALPLGWANGYYIDHRVAGKLTLSFSRQTPREISLVVCGMTLVLLIAGIVFLLIKKKVRTKSRQFMIDTQDKM